MCLEIDVDPNNPFETKNIHECARKCQGISSHFAYGTNAFGGKGCNDGLCKCHCLKVCKQLDQERYWFFRFKPGVASDVGGKSCISNQQFVCRHI